MESLSIDASPTQLRSLRKGRRVRIKQGTGFNLIVHPSTYHLVSRAFNKGKGAQVQLSREEIGANHEASMSPEMSGKGIFGPKFDSFLNKTGLSKITDPLGSLAKPFVKTMVSGLVSKIPVVGNRMAQLTNNYIDDPSKYQSKEGLKNAALDVAVGTAKDKLGLGIGRGGCRGRGRGRGQGMFTDIAKGIGKDLIRKHVLGEGMYGGAIGDEVAKKLGMGIHRDRFSEDLGGHGLYAASARGLGLHTHQARVDAGYGGAMSREKAAHLAHQHIMKREAARHGTDYDSDPEAPRSRGYGLGAGIHQGHHSIVGRGGGMLEYCPPALVSQPYSANWQMGHFLPVQFQMYNQSMHAPHGYASHGEGGY